MSEQEMLDPQAEEFDESAIPARNAPDHLPTKPGWKVILSGIFFAAFGVLLLAVVIAAFVQPGTITFIGWFIILIFVLGGGAALYSAYDEFRHLKDALALDKGGTLESVVILDDWKDQYDDGGIATRRDHFHVIYRYADGKEYAKHAIKKSDAPALKKNTRIQVQYLPEKPKVYRLLMGE